MAPGAARRKNERSSEVEARRGDLESARAGRRTRDSRCCRRTSRPCRRAGATQVGLTAQRPMERGQQALRPPPPRRLDRRPGDPPASARRPPSRPVRGCGPGPRTPHAPPGSHGSRRCGQGRTVRRDPGTAACRAGHAWTAGTAAAGAPGRPWSAPRRAVPRADRRGRRPPSGGRGARRPRRSRPRPSRSRPGRRVPCAPRPATGRRARTRCVAPAARSSHIGTMVPGARRRQARGRDPPAVGRRKPAPTSASARPSRPAAARPARRPPATAVGRQRRAPRGARTPASNAPARRRAGSVCSERPPRSR